MTCPNCGQEFSDGLNRCPYCGTRVKGSGHPFLAALIMVLIMLPSAVFGACSSLMLVGGIQSGPHIDGFILIPIVFLLVAIGGFVLAVHVYKRLS